MELIILWLMRQDIYWIASVLLEKVYGVAVYSLGKVC